MCTEGGIGWSNITWLLPLFVNNEGSKERESSYRSCIRTTRENYTCIKCKGSRKEEKLKLNGTEKNCLNEPRKVNRNENLSIIASVLHFLVAGLVLPLKLGVHRFIVYVRKWITCSRFYSRTRSLNIYTDQNFVIFKYTRKFLKTRTKRRIQFFEMHGYSS